MLETQKGYTMRCDGCQWVLMKKTTPDIVTVLPIREHLLRSCYRAVVGMCTQTQTAEINFNFVVANSS